MHSASRRLDEDLCRIGWISAAICSLLTAAWVGAMAIIPGPPADADPGARLAWLAGHPDGVVGPALVVGIALLFVPIWLGLAATIWSKRPAAGVLAVAFGLVYAPLASINYWAQLTVVRGLADLSRTDPVGAAAAYRLFEFPGGLTSLSYGLDVLAYVIWGLAALAIGVGLLAIDGRLARAVASFFLAGGVLAIVGGFGFVAQNSALELGVIGSGVAALFAMAGSAVLLRRTVIEEESQVARLSFEVRMGHGARS